MVSPVKELHLKNRIVSKQVKIQLHQNTNQIPDHLLPLIFLIIALDYRPIPS